MKKSELLEKIKTLTERVELLESMQKNDRNRIKEIKEDVLQPRILWFEKSYRQNDIPTYTKIKKILEHLGIEIYETESEIKVRSTKVKKKKKKSK